MPPVKMSRRIRNKRGEYLGCELGFEILGAAWGSGGVQRPEPKHSLVWLSHLFSSSEWAIATSHGDWAVSFRTSLLPLHRGADLVGDAVASGSDGSAAEKYGRGRRRTTATRETAEPRRTLFVAGAEFSVGFGGHAADAVAHGARNAPQSAAVFLRVAGFSQRRGRHADAAEAADVWRLALGPLQRIARVAEIRVAGNAVARHVTVVGLGAPRLRAAGVAEIAGNEAGRGVHAIR